MEQLQDVHHELDINNPPNLGTKITDDNKLHYLNLVKAINDGDWEAAKTIFDSDPSSLTSEITISQETPLHLAINSSRSPEFIRRLVDLLPQSALQLANGDGATPLHVAAAVGSVEVARILVRKSPALVRPSNAQLSGDTPLKTAAKYGHKDVISYLLSVVAEEEEEEDWGGDSSPFRGRAGGIFLILLIFDDFYGLALDVLRKFPALAREEVDGITALSALAESPHVFPSGTRIGHCRQLWHHCKSFAMRIHRDDAPKRKEHKQVMELLKLLVSEITLKSATSKEVDRLLAPAILMAAKLGVPEVVTEIVKAYPTATWLGDANGLTFFHVAVIFRQDKVFNLMYQMSGNKTLAAAVSDTSNGNNLLHMAAKLGPTETIPGAALKVQRELQWFNEVEKVVQPSYRKVLNKEMKTPRELFTKEHESLVEQGEKWMKETANSCSLVAALVVTVNFAAAFTLPGGTKDDGAPTYLNKQSLMVFVAADTLALFSSSTSLLMFLGILTSRYSERDFLRSLPVKMGVGLLTLFLSIAAMLIAFGASLHVVLYHNVNWMMAPIGLVASVPSLLFVFLQFPLLVELLFSTFGPSIFGKQNDEIIS